MMPTCTRCSQSYDLDESKASFDHYYAGSSDWKYDDVVSTDMCADCASEDADDRWTAGELDAADGSPPLSGDLGDAWRKIGKKLGW